ncbi:MAG: PHP domain-containing protein [Spirochaetaceae bacterium]
MVDLHTHSSASDGLLTPRELVHYAGSLGVRALALTDHDTVAGLPEAQEAATDFDVRIIPGIELEADYDLGALHVLGLGLRHLDEELEASLRELREARTRRNLGMIARLSELGIAVNYAEVAGYAGGGVVGRPHFAQLLTERGIAASYQDAFDRFLADGAAAHEPRSAPSIARCIHIIHAAGGTAVVAHPRTLWLSSWRKVTDALTRWKQVGLDGIEAYYAGAAPAVAAHYAEIARRLDLLVTAGSDYHGRWGRPGRTGVGMEIDDTFAAPFLESAVRG